MKAYGLVFLFVLFDLFYARGGGACFGHQQNHKNTCAFSGTFKFRLKITAPQANGGHPPLAIVARI